MSQAEAAGESEPSASAYQQAGYRIHLGPVIHRAAELALQGSLSSDTSDTQMDRSRLKPDDHALEQSEQSAEDDEQNRRLLANVYRDRKHHTVSLLLDESTANLVVYAVQALIADSEAHAREVRLVAATMPQDSYGASNRHAIASRHERISARLRLLERNYRGAVR